MPFHLCLSFQLPVLADADTYNPVDHVDVQVQVDGAPNTNHFTISSDESVIAEDTPGNQYGVDFWLNDGKGNPVKTNPLTKAPSPPLVTIFGPSKLQKKLMIKFAIRTLHCKTCL